MKWLVAGLFLAVLSVNAASQDVAHEAPPFNFNIGGGIGFPLGTTSTFTNNGSNFVVGGGPNFGGVLGLSGEFMWNDLPIKSSALHPLAILGASAREYGLTLNAIVRVPTAGRLGGYVIGGGGWYRRSGELTAPTFIPGTVCAGFWVWWGACVGGLFPADAVIASSHSNAFGGNIGGGLTYNLGGGFTKLYAEVRYHHATHDHVDTNILPLTFGLRW
jgi:hypothetical protein